MNELRSIVHSKEQRIRDIDALLAADKAIHDLQPVYDEYSTIRWKGAKERFASSHADELESLLDCTAKQAIAPQQKDVHRETHRHRNETL